MGKDKSSFSAIVSNSAGVRSAFSIHSPTQSWWYIILKLHGKPTHVLMPLESRVQRIASGFQFYAGLYRLLAGIFCLLAPTLILFDVCSAPSASSYWGTASLLAGTYLWIVSGLGYAGANAYRRCEPQSVPALLSFMVMIVAFLSMFLAVVSVVIHQLDGIATWPNLIGAALLFIFGVGSYMIEIIYLATERHFEPKLQLKSTRN